MAATDDKFIEIHNLTSYSCNSDNDVCYADNDSGYIGSSERIGSGSDDFTGKEDQLDLKIEGCSVRRPSTAVRLQVRKISEDFTKYSTKQNFEFAKLTSKLCVDSNEKNIFLKSHCLKLKHKTQSPRVCCPESKNSCSKRELKKPCISSETKQLPDEKVQNNNVRRSEYHNRNVIRKRSYKTDKIVASKFSRRKFPSTNTALANKILKVPFEQVKKAKAFTEKASSEGKVFSIHGQFPALRDALRKRGWVEKIIRNFPYAHPHPQNCACHHNTRIASVSPRAKHPCLPNLSTLCSSDTENNKLYVNHNNNNLIVNNNEIFCSNDNVNSDLDDAVVNVIVAMDNEADEPPKSGENLYDSNSMSVDSSSLESSTTDSASNSSCLDSRSNSDELKEHKESNEKLSEHKPTFTKIISKNLNTTFLAPLEIRHGIEKSINETNLSVFQYTFPPYHDFKCNIMPNREVIIAEISTNESNSTTSVEEIKEETYDEIPVEPVLSEPTVNIQLRNPVKKESKGRVFNPYPDLDYVLTSRDKPVVARVLRNVQPHFFWSWNKESIAFKHIAKHQIVNRFPNTPFTTKYGLCETLQQLHWFSEASNGDSFIPRSYCIGHEDERAAFIYDYRTTTCLNILKCIKERSHSRGIQSVLHPLGEVPIRRVRQALQHLKMFLESCNHADLDVPPLSPIRETEWDLLYSAHYRLILQEKRVKVLPHHSETLLKECDDMIKCIGPFWPQLEMDGLRNVWIVKPGAQSRGRGIILLSHLPEILSLVQSPMIYQTKYVVQKYIERPLLIYNTKFDIRQWFIVTDWNPLTLWMYKECYLRFCSQQYNLNNTAEAIHLSNNAVQCKYVNGDRDERLPEENMWDCYQFMDYLRTQNKPLAFHEIIYPGMRDALISTMLAAQVQMDPFKQAFEFFGADFMLTEDLTPWLIEINSSPCMAATTSVTKRMCYESLNDTIKVVVDYRQDPSANTGKFELVYTDKEKPLASYAYHGITLQVTGKRILSSDRQAMKQDRNSTSKIRISSGI